MIRAEEDLFNDWIEIKKKLDDSQYYPHFSEGEVWWCGLGKNVGTEINGKSQKFSRPVLIYKKFSNLCFLAIPLSTKIHRGSWYVDFIFQDVEQVAVLSQMRSMNIFRLYQRIGRLSNGDFAKVKEKFNKLYL